jgi:hypothetical protein
LDGLLPDLPVLLACDGESDGVMVDTIVTTAGVSPGLVGVWVMRIRDVWISVADGGAEGAVTTEVVSRLGVDAGGAADDGGLDTAGGGAEDAGGGLEEAGAGGGVLAGGADEGAGGCEEGGSAEDGGLDCAGDGDDGAGAAEESAGDVTDGKGGVEAGAEAAEGGGDCSGLEGEDATKEGTNVLAVPLLDMLTRIGTRNHKKIRNSNHARQAARRQVQRRRKNRSAVQWMVSEGEDVSVAECGSQRLGSGVERRNQARMGGDLGAGAVSARGSER